jgi:hypothetical protein
MLFELKSKWIVQLYAERFFKDLIIKDQANKSSYSKNNKLTLLPLFSILIRLENSITYGYKSKKIGFVVWSQILL